MIQNMVIKKIVLILLIFYSIAFVGYVVGDVFSQDNTTIIEPTYVERVIGNETYDKVIWVEKTLDYIPSIWYWSQQSVLILGLCAIFMMSKDD